MAAIEGELEEEEHDALLESLMTVVSDESARLRNASHSDQQGEENVGMAMTFTLVSHLREQMSSLVRKRADQFIAEEREKERIAIEVKIGSLFLTTSSSHYQAEEARTRGTPVTLESFKAWKFKFGREMAQRKARDEEERLRAFSPREREEWKRSMTRPTGEFDVQCFNDAFLILCQVATYLSVTRTWSTMTTTLWKKVLFQLTLASTTGARGTQMRMKMKMTTECTLVTAIDAIIINFML